MTLASPPPLWQTRGCPPQAKLVHASRCILTLRQSQSRVQTHTALSMLLLGQANTPASRMHQVGQLQRPVQVTEQSVISMLRCPRCSRAGRRAPPQP